MAEAKPTKQALGSPWLAAAHDLRQPIQTALLLVHELGCGEPRSDRGRVAEMAEQALIGLQSMLDDLMHLTHLELGVSRPAPIRLELADALARALDELGPEAVTGGAAGIVLRGVRGTVEADARHLHGMLLGLLAAAVEHGRGQPITVTARRNAGAIVIGAELTSDPLPQSGLAAMFIETRGASAGSARRMLVPGPGLAARLAALAGGAITQHQLDSGRLRLELAIGGAA